LRASHEFTALHPTRRPRYSGIPCSKSSTASTSTHPQGYATEQRCSSDSLGLRRSELVAIEIKDLSPSPDGMTVRIARSKTDQQGRGTSLLLAYAKSPNPCPVRALRAWLDGSGITDGPVFRRLRRAGTIGKPLAPQAVALIIKRRATAAGLDPKEFAGHSLRSGYATQTARDGHRTEQIADTTRHKDQTVLAGYIQAGRGRKDVATVL
jgi:integrase